ncbi:monovalent cation:proton antiporter-2 (CPA2) family protein [Methylobacterium nodulans]|uniref:Potassium efflux system protein n=1 Tax=Methylobacterium nodulans (strain LMG 21967 / CNCM I-2342 / ORS 2060) TaxID=460265 RepID=B8ILM8_METNO|nr:monovalent cation:proton antiporter-2 (CPA2) family protein [Methylobacterium nodulans]ACL62003.1 potassium efflux system protein [Methylobacterium nodulans ORS 2060]
MASTADHASFLPPVLTFLSAAVIGVPIVRMLGQSAVLGYLAAGVVIGPSGLSLIPEAETARSVSELGVVLLLFIIGLELEISRLISLRRDILGLGTLQLVTCAAALGGLAMLGGLAPAASVVVGIALALSATAVALQLLQERRDLGAPYGQRAFAILLFQDLSIVAILALLPLLASTGTSAGENWLSEALSSTGSAVAAVVAAVVVGRYGLNPFFRLLAASGAREVMTAAALLVVLGTALLMEHVGLSMAMGAFLAGLLLAESNFRHQLEADIEPFRGMLLGLFFMSVGMSIDVALVRAHWLGLSAAMVSAILLKTTIVAGLFRLFGSPWLDALRGAAVLAPAGEFAFVLLPVAGELGIVDGAAGRLAIALAALTMLVGPLAAKGLDGFLARRRTGALEPAYDVIENAEARVLVVGFGRFGQILNQVLLAQGISVTVIDKDVEQIRSAARFGFRVYYGDGTRLDVLRAAGAGRAELICICIDDPEETLKIIDLVHAEFPSARTYVRAFDRVQAIEAMNRDVDFVIRETVESALAFGRATLEALGVAAAEAAGIADDVRKRDVARLVLQQAGEPLDRSDPMRSLVRIKPEPLTTPKRSSRALTAETQDIIAKERPAPPEPEPAPEPVADDA